MNAFTSAKFVTSLSIKAPAASTLAVLVGVAPAVMPSSLVLSAEDIEPAALVVAADIPIVPVVVIAPPVIGALVAIFVTVPLPPPPPPTALVPNISEPELLTHIVSAVPGLAPTLVNCIPVGSIRPVTVNLPSTVNVEDDVVHVNLASLMN